ncbi:hypothetical protein ABI59_07525 [Acidobacteria bacterium Mor1]|nr:hypothetical protein ABI59_07525 [Acidobacteria bacterium Mor1]
MNKQKLRRGVLFAIVCTAVLVGGALVGTPYSVENCAKSAETLCPDGGTVEFTGHAYSSDCHTVCDDSGQFELVDRSWPFGEDR